MRGLGAVAARELAERRPLLLAAPILALVPLAGPFLPGLSSYPVAEVRLGFTVLIGVVLPLALALGLGASALGDEVGGRRLGFYFARPLGPFAIWGGKMAVALGLPVAAATCILGPLILLARIGGDEEPRGIWLATAAACLLLTSVAQVAAGLYRTRSTLLALDLVLGTVVVGGFVLLGRRLLDSGAAPRLFRWVGSQLGDSALGPLGLLGALLTLVSLAAGYAQVRSGRGDLARGHRAASAFLWGGLGVGLAGTSAFVAWLANPSPRDVVYRAVVPLAGESLLLNGPGGGMGSFPPVFLVDSHTGAARRLTVGTQGGVSSPNGRHALFVEGLLSPRLVVVSATAGTQPTVTRIALDGPGPAWGLNEAWPLCLSDDGMRVVLRRGREAHVVDTATGRRLDVPGLGPAACSFEGRERLVLFYGDPSHNALYRQVIDLQTGAQRERVTLPQGIHVLAAQGGRVLARMRPENRMEIGLFDAETGRLVRRLGVPAEGSEGSAFLLPDGGVAFVGAAEDARTLRVFDREGTERAVRQVTAQGKAAVAGVTPEDEVVVVARENGALQTLFLDLRTLQERRRLTGMRPAYGRFAGFDDPSTRLRQSQERFRQGLFLDDQQALVRLGPGRDERRVLVAAPPAADRVDYWVP